MTDADRIAREKSLERLRIMAMSLLRENERLVARLGALYKQVAEAKGEAAAQLRLEIAALEREIEKRREQIFQHQSEKRPAGKGQEGEQAKPPQKGHGPREQPKLQVEEVVHDLDDADKTCDVCGGDLEEWEGQVEESDEVEVVERRYVIKRHKRKKYRCRCGSCIETAPAPRKLIEGGRYSVNFAITVAVDKYLMHLPLERQVAAMARLGLEVDSQTLFDQLWALNRLLLPAYQRLADEQRARPLLFVDESRWPLLGVKGKGAASTKWHIWTLVSDLGVYYEIYDGRDADSAEDLLAGFQGYVMCDGFSVYEALAKAYPEIRLVQCWVHARRNFVECSTAFPTECAQILDLIGKLYEIEKRAGEDENERRRLRNEESRKVLGEIQRWVVEVRSVPGTALHAAITYMTNRWSRLIRFVDHPALPLDNNPAERALRGPVVGRKNHYGSRSVRGTQVAALFYSLLESAKLVGIDPAAYLRTAVEAAFAGEQIPLPHEIAKRG
ncbi:MAG: IS66 family transposase [Byssovorax sp.]